MALIPNIGDLSNKVAIVTGASSGVGRAIAEAFAAAGAFVVSADLTPNPPTAPVFAQTMKESAIDITTPTVDLLNDRFPPLSSSSLAASAKASSSRAVFVQCDVSSSDSVRNAVATAVQTYGRLDIMVNNAGISAIIKSSSFQSGGLCRPHEVEDEVFDKDMAVNVRGVWLGTKHAAAQFLAQPAHSSGDRGWIINICSVSGIVATPAAASYTASKGAVLQLTKATALDYAGERIHVNCINPGWVDTAMLEPMRAKAGGEPDQVEAQMARLRALHPWGRLARPDDIANMAVFLAGPGASFCTGQAYIVDGGYTAQ